MIYERHLDDRLDRVEQALQRLAGAAVQSTTEAVRALIERDPALAGRVVGDGQHAEQMEVELEDACLGLFALCAPSATDLRQAAVMLKISTDLERAIDQALGIARSAAALAGMDPVRPLVDIARMADIATEMVRQAVQAFVSRDVALAEGVRRRGDELGALRDQNFRDLLTYMMADLSAIDRCMGLVMVARSLERIGDHAANIARDAVHLVRGRVPQHRHALVPAPLASGHLPGVPS